MTKIANIKRLRWNHTQSANTRWYGVSIPLKLNDKNEGGAIINEPVNTKNWCGLTELGRKIVNKIIRMEGVTILWAQAHAISVEIAPIYQWNDGFHEAIISLLNKTLFDGQATIIGPDVKKSA